jgi:hypothetical protein
MTDEGANPDLQIARMHKKHRSYRRWLWGTECIDGRGMAATAGEEACLTKAKYLTSAEMLRRAF